MTSDATPTTSHTQVPYDAPGVPQLLSVSAYLYLLSFSSSLCSKVINAPLLGPLLIGIFFGPALAGLLPAGLTTDISLLVRNLWLSIAAALTGIGLPIGLSMALLGGAYGYGGLQAFAGGAALCSTSLGTTLALLTPALRRTRVGSVLVSAALLDDVVGLVIAAIISNFASSETSPSSSHIAWQTIARPILVSMAFTLLTPLLAYCIRNILWIQLRLPRKWRRVINDSRVQLFLIVSILSAFVAGSKYAGMSELFGAYLAGAFMVYIFRTPDSSSSSNASAINLKKTMLESHDPPSPSSSYSEGLQHDETPPLRAYATHLEPILISLLGPIFFASIGAALPVGALFTANGSHAVVWRGIVYSVLMVLAKMGVGVWMLIWPEPGPDGRGWFGMRRRRRKSRNPNIADEERRDPSQDKGQDYLKSPLSIDVLPARLDSGIFNGSRPSLPPSPMRSALSLPDIVLPVASVSDSGLVSTAGPYHPSPPHPLAQTDEERLATPTPTSHKDPTQTPDPSPNTLPRGMSTSSSSSPTPFEPTRLQGAALLALAMVARGEIALIVAQLARHILLGPEGTADVDEEPFAVIIWAILVCTIGGALGVGVLLRSWKRKEGGGR